MPKPINLCIDTNSRNLEWTECRKLLHQLRNAVNIDMQATEKIVRFDALKTIQSGQLVSNVICGMKSAN